jgi:isorenieratene synthase
MNQTHPVIVIGGGLAGLSAAVHLAEAGCQPLLLEAAPRLGGRVAGGETVTLEHGGQPWHFTAEHGIHGLWGQYHNLRALLARCAPEHLLVPAYREDWLHADGSRVRRAEAGSVVRRSIFPAPFHYLGLLARPSFLAMLTPADLIGLPRVVGSLYLALAYDPLGETTPLAGRTVAELFTAWPPRLRAFLTALMRSGLADQPDQVPLSGFLAFLRFYTLLRRDAWAFSYFPADSGTALIAPLAAAITAHGGTIRTNADVGQVKWEETGWRVQWAESTTAYSAAARHLIVALDAPAAQRLFSRSPTTAAHAAELHWPTGLATGVVRLWFDRAPAQGAESGICSGEFTIDNFFWLHQFQTDVADWHRVTGGSLVEAHIYGPPAVLELPDATLLARAISDIQRAYPELRGHLIHQTLQRNQASHTRFGAGSAANQLAVASPWPQLSCCGDWIAHPHPALFLERATVTGIAAAAEACATLDRPAPSIIPASPPEAPARALERALRRVRKRVRG